MTMSVGIYTIEGFEKLGNPLQESIAIMRTSGLACCNTLAMITPSIPTKE